MVATAAALSMMEELHRYFSGERQIGWALVVVAVGLGAAATWVMRTQQGAFAWWLGVPFAVVAVAGGVGGATLAVKTGYQVEALTAQYASDPAGMIAQESPRMAKVNANWPRLKLAWTVIIVAALCLLQLHRKEWAVALGLALLLIATLLFFADVFAERRAKVYTRALEAEAARIKQ